MATTSPAAAKACTSRSFCSGMMRAKMFVRARLALKSVSSSSAIAVPVSTVAPTMPACCAMASAVAG